MWSFFLIGHLSLSGMWQELYIDMCRSVDLENGLTLYPCNFVLFINVATTTKEAFYALC